MQRPQPEPVTLDDILITEELSERSPRLPNLQAENQALHTLARQLVSQPETMLQSSVDILLNLCSTGTAGVSLLETTPDGEEVFRWNVLAGALAQYVGGTTPRNFSPCGVCLERGTPQLYEYPDRYFTYFQAANTPIVESLVLPLIADNHALGTIWIMSHSEQRHFDAEDVRVMTSLADFTTAALLLQQRQTRELLAANAALETEIAERKQAEARFLRKASLTRALISNLPGGAAFVVDRDLRYLLAEGEALAIAGFKPEDLVGKTIFEVLPPELATYYEPMYRKALAGEPFEHEHNAHDRTYISRGTPLRAENGEIYAVLAVSYDISDRKRVEDERKRTEEVLRESEEHQAFLLKFSDALRAEPDADSIARRAVQMLAEHLRLDRVWLAEVFEQQGISTVGPEYYQPDLPPMSGVFRLSDYPETMRQIATQPMIIHDVANDPGFSDAEKSLMAQLHLRALLVVALRKGQHQVIWALVFAMATPRHWNESERVLLEQVSERVWAAIERARAEAALRKSEEKYRSLFNSINEGFCVIELIDDDAGRAVDYRFLEVNPIFEHLTGVQNVIGKTDKELNINTEAHWLENYDRVARTGESLRLENYHEATEHWYQAYVSRVGGEGSRQVAIVFDDISDRKQSEQEIKRANQLWQTMFDNSLQFIQLFKAVRDDRGDIVDFEWLLTNKQWNDRWGEMAGKRMLTENPAVLETGLFEKFKQVTETGVAEVQEHHYAYEQFDGWFLQTAAKVEDGFLLSTLDITERKRAEIALRESEEKYRSLFDSIDEGFCIFELLYDDEGNAVDWIYTEANPAFERQTGYINPIGRCISEFQPDLERSWFERFAEVARTGEPVRFVQYTEAMGIWYDVYALPVGAAGDNRVSLLFTDITDRKRAEERQAFLLKFSDALRTEPDVDAVANRALQMLIEQLQLDRSYITTYYLEDNRADLNYQMGNDSVPPLPDHFVLSDFPEALKATLEGTLVIEDDWERQGLSEAEKRNSHNLGMRAMVAATLRKDENKPLWSMVAISSRPRRWTPTEIALVEEVADHTWAAVERARAEEALRESEEKFSALFAASPVPFMVLEPNPPDFTITAANEAYFAATLTTPESLIGRRLFDVFTDDPNRPGQLGSEALAISLDRVLSTRQTDAMERTRYDLVVPGGFEPHWWDAINAPLLNASGQVTAIIHQVHRVTELHFAEVAERQNQERQAFLLKLSEILQRFVQPNDIKAAAMRLLGEHLGVSRAQYHECDSSGEYYSADGVGYANGLPLLDLKYQIDAFGTFVNEDFAAGRPYRSDDLTVDPRISAEERDAYRTYQIRAGAGVPLIRGGKLVAILAIHDVHPHPWTDLEMDLIRETAERIWTPLERARAESALRGSEEKYRSLFTSIDEGFTLLEMIPDESGHPTDFRILETNQAWEQQTGLTDATGKTLLEIDPNFEQHWLDFYSDVVISGRGRRTEYYTASVDRWYTVYASRSGGEGSHQVAAVFNDITERKRREAHQEFLLKLSDALRPLSDAVEIQQAAARVIGEYLGVDRAYYVDIEPDDEHWVVADNYVREGAPPLIGRGRIDDFGWAGKELLAGRILRISDVNADPNLSESARAEFRAVDVAALLAISLQKEGRWSASFALQHLTPREWSEAETKLLQETAERTWAAVERAKAEAALRESELQRVREQSAREEERQRAESLAELDRAKTHFFSNVSHEFRTPLTLSLAPLQDALSDRTNPLDPPQRERLELAHRNAIRLLKLVNTLLDFSRIEAGRMEAVYEPTDLALFTTELASVFRSAIERAGLRLIVDCPPLLEPVYVDRQMWEKIVLNLLSNAFKFTLEGEIAVRLHLADGDASQRNDGGDRVMLQVQDTGTGIPPEELPHVFERFYQVRRTKARTHEGSGIGLALVHELIHLHGGTVDVSSTVGEGTCFTITIPLGTAHLPSDRLHRVVGDRITATRTPLASTAIGAAPYVEEAERWLPPENAEFRPPSPPILGGTGVQGSPILGGTGVQSSPIVRKTEVQSPPELGDLGGEKDLRVHGTPASPTSPARVLLVDDNADMREYLTRILSEHVQVEAVADGASALAAAQERSPDLVLTDVMMPGLDGFELLKALRANPRTREIPIILLSARAGEESVVEGLEAGADDYLIKPFSAGQLVSRVKGHLQMAQLRLEALHQERTLNRRKDELLSTVSHELNTPLVAILGWTRLLRANPPNQSMLMKSLETIERNATLQAKLVQDLLDMSRITAGKLRLSLEPVELELVIENAIAAVLTAAIAKDIHLQWNIGHQASDAPTHQEITEIFVLGDRDRLQQIITNLLTNAIKFTPNRGNINIELSVIERHNGSDASIAEISVTDTGIGISAEFLPHVFDRFRQAQESSASKGLGLGLAIARHLVELHNGTIRAQSAGIGQGATFVVRLPLMQ